MQLLLAFSLCAPLVTVPLQEDDPRSARWERVGHLVDLVQTDAPDLKAFVRGYVAVALRDAHGDETLVARLGTLIEPLRGGELDDAMPEDETAGCLVFVAGPDQHQLLFRIEPAAPHRFVDVWFEFGAHLDPDAPVVVDDRVPLTWETLGVRLAQEEAAGLSGALLVQRDGEVVLRRGFGYANPEEELPNRPDTVFGTGSLPIDYTRAALLLLVDAGVVSLDDTLEAYFEDVPADKRRITVGMLMNGASGLPDFHGRPGDRDPDHHWIDRDEAVRRILENELLFPPGTGNEHSHSAWGLVAAIVEIASGQSYREFLNENFFEPLGMHDTGFYGDPVPAERLAIGHGEHTDGEVNAPPFWGPTSWLVLGSGGMTSTVDDMARWLNGMRSAELLSPEAARRFWSPPGSLAKAGSIYGFEVWYVEGPGSFFVLFTNDSRGGIRRRNDRLAEELMRLCLPSPSREAGSPR